MSDVGGVAGAAAVDETSGQRGSGGPNASNNNNNSLENQRLKELRAAVAATLAGENPQAIRSLAHASLRQISISTQNNPVHRAFLLGCLAPDGFLHCSVAFMPRQVTLEENANIMLLRKRQDDNGIGARLYQYAMLLYYNACRRGSGSASWSYQDPISGATVWVEQKRKNLLVTECVYARGSGDLVGWYLYSYDNVAPPPPVPVDLKSIKRAKRQREKQEKKVESACKRARQIFSRKKNGGAEAQRWYVDNLDSSLAGLVRAKLIQERVRGDGL